MRCLTALCRDPTQNDRKIITRANEAGECCLLCGSVLVLNATVDKGRKSRGGVLDGTGILGDGELLHELIEHLDALSVL